MDPFQEARNRSEPDGQRILAIVQGLRGLAEDFENQTVGEHRAAAFLLEAVRAGAFSADPWLEFFLLLEQAVAEKGMWPRLFLYGGISWLRAHRDRLPIDAPPTFEDFDWERVSNLPLRELLRAWLLDLAALLGQTISERTVQSGAKVKEAGEKRDRCPRGQASEWILSCVCTHHEYDGQSIGNWDSFPTLDDVVTGLQGRVSKGAISGWFKESFGGFSAYKAACQQETLLPKLQKMRQDFNEFFDPEEVLLNRPDSRAADPAHD